MPTNDFGTAIYTNCAPDQGLDGVAGMQFQSRSDGVDREALAVIRRHLIYEPPDRLIQEQRPVNAFPPSFAHVYDGLFATAEGVYIGQEAIGSRQGNHLTHAIVTGSAQAYRSVRPVQLFRASFWRTEPAASKESERLGPSWQPGPLDAGRAGRFVREQPDGPALLAAILTALHAHLGRDQDAAPRRVLFISDNADAVLLWLTAATLLIPQHEAVRLGFKVFTADPARSALPVIAVHPEWVRSAATVEHDRGYVVFDLVRHLWTAIEPSAGASGWARWFCQADPYEVSEAVELAEASKLPGETARDLATAAVLRQEPPPGSASRLAHWLQHGPPALREAYGGTLTAALVPSRDLHVLREVDDAAANQFPGRRDQVRLALLRLELDNALRNPIEYQPKTPQRPVSAAIKPEATRLARETLRRAYGSAFDAVLRVSRRFEIKIRHDDVRDAADAFAEHWAAYPDAAYDPSAWPPTLPVSDLLRAKLSERISEELADAWYRRLPGWVPATADLTSPLERALLSAAMAKSAPPERMRIIRSVLRHRGPASPGRYRDVAELLWRRVRPTMDELRELASLVPDGETLSHAVFAEVLDGVHGDPAQPEALMLCASLAGKHLLEVDPATGQLLADDRWLQQFERQLGTPQDAPGSDGKLGRMSPGLLNGHARPLARGLIDIGTGDPARVKRLLDMLPDPVVVTYLQGFLEYQTRPLAPGEVALIWATRSRLPGTADGDGPPPQGDAGTRLGRDLDNVVQQWCRAAPRRSIGTVARYLTSFGGGLAARWDQYTAEVRRSRLWRDRGEPGFR